MEWTTEQPTKTGLYWAFDGLNVVAVDVYKSNGGTVDLIGFELGSDYESMRYLDEYTHWMPLEQPEPPK
jgi:hypothetical protein